MAITLAGQSLPDPQRMTVTAGYRGKGSTMLDGTTKFDLVDSTEKETFTLGWVALNDTQKAALQAAWASMKIATGSLVFVAHGVGEGNDYYTSTPYTVTRSPSSPDLNFDGITAAGGIQWAVTINLIED